MATDEETRELVRCLKSQFNEAIVDRTVYKGHLRYPNRALTRIRIKNGKMRRNYNQMLKLPERRQRPGAE